MGPPELAKSDDLTLGNAPPWRGSRTPAQATSAELARAEQISPQSMGVSLAPLEDRGLIARGRDPQDGRRVVYSFAETGRQWRKNSRNERTFCPVLIIHADTPSPPRTWPADPGRAERS